VRNGQLNLLGTNAVQCAVPPSPFKSGFGTHTAASRCRAIRAAGFTALDVSVMPGGNQRRLVDVQFCCTPIVAGAFVITWAAVIISWHYRRYSRDTRRFGAQIPSKRNTRTDAIFDLRSSRHQPALPRCMNRSTSLRFKLHLKE
jgi:hypothetical protein